MSNWYKASDLERARTPMVMSSETGLPDNHVITVTERVISIDNTELIQNNIATDTFTLVLDAEWDDITPITIFSNDTGDYSVMYEGSATKIPAKAMERVGDIQVSVYGVNDEGDVRVVTQKPESMGMTVIESGKFDGQVSADDVSLLGQILQAVSDAETAITAAETATSAATNATSQATLAATSAKQAASSANSAASSANSAATRATSAAVNAENAYDTLQPYMATIDSCANVLHREVGPDSVVTADDAFPAKPVEMVVYGNTVQNLWVNPSGTNNGVTVTANADGSITVSGTATNTAIVQVISYALKPAGEYTLSIDKSVSSVNGCGVSVEWYKDNTAVSNIMIGYGSTLSGTFTIPGSTEYCKLRFRVASGTTVSGTYRVMLNEGSTAEPWCPPGLNSVGDGGSVEVVTAGKNLLPADASDWRKASDTSISIDGDSITVSSTSGVYNNASFDAGFLAGKTVHFGFESRSSDSTRFNLQLNVIDGGKNIYYGQDKSPVTIPASASSVIVCLYSNNSNIDGAYSCTFTKPYLRVDGTAEYAPLSGFTETPIDLQGHTLNSLPDGTRDELHIDGGGNVVLEKRTWSDVFNGTESWSYSSGRYGLNGALTYESDVGNDDAIQRLIADKLPVVPIVTGHTGIRAHSGTPRWVDANITTIVEDLNGFKGWLKNNNTTLIYPLAEPQTINLGTITPPTMAAPNITAYVADDTPAEMELDYVRDINIALADLEAKIADLVTKEAANV